MASFTTDLRLPLYSWWPLQTALYYPSLKNPDLSPDMPKTSENPSLSPYSGKETVTMTGKTKKKAMEVQERPGKEARNSEIKVTTIFDKTMNATDVTVIQPDRLAIDAGEVLLSDWLEWESDDEQDEGDDCSDEDKAQQLPREEEDETGWSDEEDSDWSDDGDSEVSSESTELWESFFNNSDPYNPLCLSCLTGVKPKASDTRQNRTPSSPTASEVEKSTSTEEHNPERSAKQRTIKVRFSEEVIVHHLTAWSFADQAARDGSCWLEQARDGERFRRRVEETGKILSPCFTAQHRARVWDRLQRGSQPEPEHP